MTDSVNKRWAIIQDILSRQGIAKQHLNSFDEFLKKGLLFAKHPYLASRRIAYNVRRGTSGILTAFDYYNYPYRIIFLAGMAMSASTWMKNLLARIPGYYTRNTPMPKEVSYYQNICDSAFNNVPKHGYTLFKTHLNPFDENLDCIFNNGVEKVLITYRDLRDVVLSRYYRMIEFPKPLYMGDFIDYNANDKFEIKISNPGCYATSILSPLIPLVKEKYIQTNDIIIDSKSGISGAGKKSVTENLFSEVSNSIKPYKIAEHKHLDEIEKCISNYSDKKNVKVSFTPHVIPINRGISSNIYIRLEKGRNIQNIKNFFEKKNFTFLKMLKINQIPTIKDVVGTNYCFFNVFPDRIKGRIIIISVIDNLIKGAAGQAIQNMNLNYNFKEDEGLDFNPIFP